MDLEALERTIGQVAGQLLSIAFSAVSSYRAINNFEFFSSCGESAQCEKGPNWF